MNMAALTTSDGRPTLHLQRRLAHPPEKVWRAITDPDELVNWFPARLETTLEPGAPIRFTFENVDPDPDPDADASSGTVLEVDPPRLFAYRWGRDELRWEIVPDGAGCVLRFTHVLSGTPGTINDRYGAARHAAGWEVCLEYLAAELDGRPAGNPEERMLTLMERYIDSFGIGVGEIRDGTVVRFERDFFQPIGDIWANLVDASVDAPVAVGGPTPPRTTNKHVPAGPVTAVDIERLLEYSWLHDGVQAGRVRWELHPTEWGCRVVLTQTVPTDLTDQRAVVLAAWHTHLELFFAAVFGEPRPWPDDRTEELTKMYSEQLAFAR